MVKIDFKPIISKITVKTFLVIAWLDRLMQAISVLDTIKK